MEVISFSLVDADTGNVIIDPLLNGQTINLDGVGHNLSIRANCSPCRVGSVLWDITVAGSMTADVTHSTDNDFPYSIRGDSGQPECKYVAWRPEPGSYDITATPYDGRDATGSAGTSLTLTLTFTESGVTPDGVDGWTTFGESGDTKKIYVSTSGSDGNDGLTTGTPVATIAHAMTLMRGDGNPDWILLKRGDTWTENFAGWSQSGKSEVEPALISYYGASGDPPVINNREGWSCQGLSQIDHVAIVGVSFTCSAKDPDSVDFDAVMAKRFLSLIRANSPMDGLLIEGCWFQFGDVEIVNDVSNLRIRRNVFKGNYVQNGNPASDAGAKAYNVYINNGGNDFVVEDNIFDYGGWHPTVANSGRQALAHNLYTDVGAGASLIRRNIFCRGATNGCLQRGGGTQDDNLFVECVAVGLIASRPSIFTNNVALSGADLDAENPRGYGPEARVCPTLLMDGNIVANKSVGVGGGNSYYIEYRDTRPWHTGEPSIQLPENPRITVTNNIAYNWRGAYLARIYDGTLTMSGNVYVGDDSHPAMELEYTTATLQMSGNKWFNTASAGQRMKINGSLVSFPAWQARTGDTSVFEEQEFVDPDRTVETYNVDELSGSADLDDFMDSAKLQWKENWDDAYHAPAVNDYIRDGFVPA